MSAAGRVLERGVSAWVSLSWFQYSSLSEVGRRRAILVFVAITVALAAGLSARGDWVLGSSMLALGAFHVAGFVFVDRRVASRDRAEHERREERREMYRRQAAAGRAAEWRRA